MSLPRFLQAPVFPDEEQSLRAGFLHLLTLSITVALLGYWIVLLVLRNQVDAYRLVVIGFATALYPLVLLLNRYGPYRTASVLFLLVGYGGLTGLAFFAGGVTAPAISTYIVLIVCAGLLLGNVYTLILALLCSCTTGLLVFAGRQGLLPPPVSVQNAATFWLAEVFNFLLAAIVLGIAVRRLERAVLRGRQEIERSAKATQALRESQRFIQSITESTPYLVFLYDPVERRNVYANRHVQTDLGYTRSEIEEMGPHFLDRLMHREDQIHIHRMERELRSGAEGAVSEGEVRLRDATGRWRWFVVRVRVFERSEGGGIGLIIGTAQDVTDRRQSEEALRESERRFRTLVDHAPEAIVVLDADTGRFVDFNQNAMQLFGRSRSDLLALGPGDLSPPFQASGEPSGLAARARIEAVLAGAPQTFEWLHLRADGAPFLCEVRLVSLPWAGRRLLRGSLADISERKETERRLQDARMLEKEWELARQIQTALLPRDLANPFYDVRAIMAPARQVGGDYYDLIYVQGRLWFVVGDVSGHGLTAGLVSIMVRTTLQAILLERPASPPEEVFDRVNRRLIADMQRLDEFRYLTCTLFVTADGVNVSYAGRHMPPLLLRASGQLEEAPAVGTWMGIEEFTRLPEYAERGHLRVEPGDRLILFSDGITEAMDANEGFYGRERLDALIQSHAQSSPGKLHEAIVADVRSFMRRQEDDITLMILENRGVRPGAQSGLPESR